MKSVRLGLFGAGGRMGTRVRECLAEAPDLSLVCALGRGAPPSARFTDCDVVIDFSVAAATGTLLGALEGSGAALVTGTTGRDAEQSAAIGAYAAVAPLLAAANFSVGVALLERLVALAAGAVDWDVELFELHHRQKRDAPSGTALTLAAAAGRGLVGPRLEGLREQGSLGIGVGRGGDVVGEHTVYVLGEGERLELTHRATDRRIFARGALRAARWLAGRPAGQYTLAQVLEFSR